MAGNYPSLPPLGGTPRQVSQAVNYLLQTAIPLSKLEAIPADTVVANGTGVAASPAALTMAELTALLPVFTSSLNGLVPAPNDAGTTLFLREDGVWAVPPGSSSSGTVTNVSVVTANGVSGSVANPSTSAAITLSLGAITPTSVAATGTVTGSNLSGTNTGDQTITLTGDVTGSGTGSFATAISANAVTFSKLVAASAASLIGATAAGNHADLTPAQAKTVLAITAADVSGLGYFATGTDASHLTGSATLSGLTVTGTFQSIGANLLGPQTATADGTTYLDNSNVNSFLYARSWSGGVPTTIGSITFNATGRTISLDPLSSSGAIILKNNGTIIAQALSSGFYVWTGPLFMNTTQVISGAGVLQAAAFPALTGDVTTTAGSLATAIASHAVTFPKMVAASAASIVGATAAGDHADLTPAQAKSVLAITTSDVSGLPALANGTYTPTASGTANVSSITPSVARYIRLGSVVFVSGQLSLTTTATGNTTFTLTLPISSNLSAASDLSGTLASDAGSTGGSLKADTTNHIASCRLSSPATSATLYYYTFSYVIE